MPGRVERALPRAAVPALSGAVALALPALTGILLAACGSSAHAPSAAAAPSIPTPLATSVQTSAGTWATVAMGHLEQPLNTFWQLLFRPAGSASWSNQVQATAVATNGGLVLASPRGQGLLVGVRPTNLLTFSPLILTSGAGSPWSTGLLPEGLAARPGALAAASASDMIALVNGRDGAQVLTSTGGPSAWRTAITARALASTAAGRSCGLASLTAVADMTGTALAGGSCSRPGVVGVFAERAGGWRLLAPAPPQSLAHDRIEVLALQDDGNGLGALLGSSAGNGVSLVAAWYGDGRWSGSQPLRVSAAEQVSSFGPASGNGMFVLFAAPSGPAQLAVASSPGAAWRQLAPPPGKTATVAFGPGASVDALVVQDTVLSVWALTARASTWAHRQTVKVPIEFGSSE